MFAFHETTRKYVSRIAFVALCVAPTLFTAWWIAGHHWPGRKGRLARELSESLNVHVKLANWREPRPRVVRVQHLTISDPSSAQLLTELNLLEVHRGAVRAYTLDEVTIEAAQLDRVAAKVLGWTEKLPPEVHEIRCRRLNLRFTDGRPAQSQATSPRVFTLHHIRGRINRDAAGRRTIQLMGYETENPTEDSPKVTLTLAPSSDAASAAPALTLESIGVAIPGQVLSSAALGFGSLGVDATFRGIVRWTLAQPETTAIAQGRLDGVDLAKLLPADSPHTLQGQATVELSELSWRGARIERLAGAVHAEHVQMSRSLIDAAAFTHGFQCRQDGSGTPVAGEPSLVSVDVLAVQFQLDAEGLVFSGNCPPDVTAQPGCIAVSGVQPLVIEPPYPGHKWPLGVLFQTLSARPTAWLPATRDAVDMASRLPLPLR
ncbi:MAG TPA: hypothetical protein VF175_14345 [Lacipirellula sp.]